MIDNDYDKYDSYMTAALLLSTWHKYKRRNYDDMNTKAYLVKSHVLWKDVSELLFCINSEGSSSLSINNTAGVAQ